MNLNKVILIGRIASDINLSDSRSGVAFARFSIAITRDNFSNDREDITDFISVVTFRNNATFLSRFFNKGDLVSVTGSLQTSQYTSKSGDIITSTNVVADQVKSLEPRSVTQARAEKNNNLNSILNSHQNNENDKATFYAENQKNDLSEDDPWELDF